MKSAKAFIKSLHTNTEMQQSISQANWSVEAIVRAGAAAGFAFTGEEFRSAYAELADDELAAVTGGAARAGCGSSWTEPC